ncbi:MAG: NAD(P)H-dependent oxidoreductase subunit E [candidate division Zixibacteria bacterium]|jgi:NADH-quinone oxidoreductase subunit E|nr:NAD(P)H-dependent oxidoreductase subunit E [candidate division Zixibacteria bacterium]
MKHDLAKVPEIIGRYPQQPSSLIMVLQDIQKEFSFLPCEALEQTAKSLGVPLSKVFSVSTFYNAFSLNKKGDTVVRVCIGTACHIRGARQIQEQMETALKIKAGETTADGKFTLEVVGCVGACAMAPVVMTNERYHPQCKVNTVKKLVAKR